MSDSNNKSSCDICNGRGYFDWGKGEDWWTEKCAKCNDPEVLRERLRQAEQRAELAEGHCRAVNERCGYFSRDQEDLREKLRQAEKRAEKAEAEIKQLKAEVASYRDDVKIYRSEADRWHTQCQKVTETLCKAERERDQLRVKVSILENETYNTVPYSVHAEVLKQVDDLLKSQPQPCTKCKELAAERDTWKHRFEVEQSDYLDELEAERDAAIKERDHAKEEWKYWEESCDTADVQAVRMDRRHSRLLKAAIRYRRRARGWHNYVIFLVEVGERQMGRIYRRLARLRKAAIRYRKESRMLACGWVQLKRAQELRASAEAQTQSLIHENERLREQLAHAQAYRWLPTEEELGD